jgi:small subunit ribosomal protein S9
MTMSEQQRYFQGTGRRKTAVARVRLYPGNGEFVVNGRTSQEFFGGRVLYQHIIRAPLAVAGLMDSFNVLVKVRGGGFSGKADAVRLGVARALVDSDPSIKPTMRQNGFLTRDARKTERKKPGLVKARRAKQYTKR